MNNIFDRIICDISVNEPIKTFIVGNIQRILIQELKTINKKFDITTLSGWKKLDEDTTNSLINEKFDFLIIDGTTDNLYEILQNCKKICNINNVITILNFNMEDYISIWELAENELNLHKLMLINLTDNKTVIWGKFKLN